jgi:hypothetical protein
MYIDMSIEDIQYLYDNSVKDNFIFYCDSALRDRDFFPKPNNYSLKFDQPFKFVTGVDVLDASIPSTMYNIETDGNSVAGFNYTLNPSGTTDGYSLQSLLEEVQNFDEFDTSFNNYFWWHRHQIHWTGADHNI